jgi:hypothetical protein
MLITEHQALLHSIPAGLRVRTANGNKEEAEKKKKKKKNCDAVSYLSSRSLHHATQLHNNYSRKFTFLSGFEIIRI